MGRGVLIPDDRRAAEKISLQLTTRRGLAAVPNAGTTARPIGEDLTSVERI